METTLVPTIQDRIRELVKASRLTGIEYAKKIGVSTSVVNGITGGRRNIPSAETLEKILVAFPQVSAEWLLTGQGSMWKAHNTATVQGSGNAVAASHGANVNITLADCEKELAACRATVQGLQELVAAKNETIAALRGQK